MAEIIQFKHLPLVRCLMAIRSLRIRDCCGIIWLLDLVVGKRFDPKGLILPRAYLFGADAKGRFRLQGGITPRDPMENIAKDCYRVGMAFQVTSAIEDILRLRVDQGGQVSNVRYMAFPPSITRRQVSNDSFDIGLTQEPQTKKEGNHG